MPCSLTYFSPQRHHLFQDPVEADNLENYLWTVERAEELEENIDKTNDLIDEVVYELYGLTDEEIEIVEEATTE